MHGLYCINFKEHMIAGKALLDHNNLFSPNDYQKNKKIIYKKFKENYDKRNP